MVWVRKASVQNVDEVKMQLKAQVEDRIPGVFLLAVSLQLLR